MEFSFAWNKACDLDQAVEAMTKLPVFSNEWDMADWRSHRQGSGSDQGAQRGQGFALHQVLDILEASRPMASWPTMLGRTHASKIAAQWRADHAKTLWRPNGWSSMGYGMPGSITGST